MIDMTAIVALKSIVESFEAKDKKLIFSGLNQRVLKKYQPFQQRGPSFANLIFHQIFF